MQSHAVEPADDKAIRTLYHDLLVAWNKRDAHASASLFDLAGIIVGFDGSTLYGRLGIESELAQIFADHYTSAYIAKIRDVRFLTADVAVLQAVAGMVPEGETDLNPAVNAVQSLVATRETGKWRVALFQNTPAAFHGRPELSKQLTRELREALRAQTGE